ncbi:MULTISPECIES: AMP-dependent synthetase/ligase [unclassified Novosphingobium]|uniref:AMP-dependent synthetase/ligase n=1 Tax=unclassified Novosphingobium TaxID=2644732 RepID=UPI00086A4D0E|nr:MULTISPECIES: long-chain fatty acid--CoA ligase [unclassified Novosphingobium]MBN9142761.1 long-chain fatty acid--CoA ligase [Novosphingobium sp.]MDR6705845.1 long-chain acyl-CoA synthetase [Novosphingobium sp. 1748]ODU85067.1 MAG: AMP-dependent synthetase [Novosphingobium sp. SCN 63-17]OJX89156.1 MAG: long-chain fatty acid--CoA ligase [Novosphingobium sp. 63-713]
MRILDIETSPNLVTLFLARADLLADRPFLHAKTDQGWQAITWAEAARRVVVLAQNLVRLGYTRGERIMLVSENRPEWCIADLAIMAAGCITVPAYTTNTERDHLHILENSGSRGVIVSTAKLAKPLLPAVMRSGGANHLIAMEPLGMAQASTVEYHGWDAMLEGDAVAARAAVEARMSRIDRTDTACLIYTSGTGGAPRGVMQHHGAILHNVAGAAHVIVEDFGWDPTGAEPEVFLSFLPLSHAYEHSAGQFFPIGLGGQIWYAEGLDKLGSNIEEVRPTIMVVVPRLFEVLRTRIMKQVEKQGKLAAGLLESAVALAARRGAGKGKLLDWPLDKVLEKLLRPKIRARFGGRVKALVSGGAPLNPEIGLFFQGVGLTLLQGYGQTESGPIASVNRPSTGIKMDTVGTPLPATEVRIAEDGEILLRGELVMHGYWRNEAETARVLKDGWLHTGDIGHIDAAGRIVITDRKKDMIVNDKGDNISPQKLEGMLTLQPEIAQAMVFGDKRPYIVGLIVPDAEWAREWAVVNGHHGADVRALQELPSFRGAIREAVDRVNRDLSVIEKVRQFTFADEPFAIDNEEMTPSLKIRRHKLKERYGVRLEGLYKG